MKAETRKKIQEDVSKKIFDISKRREGIPAEEITTEWWSALFSDVAMVAFDAAFEAMEKEHNMTVDRAKEIIYDNSWGRQGR